MKKLRFFLLFTCIFLFFMIDTGIASIIWADGVSQTSGWFDAEKDNVNSDDDDLCWAASAANILAWSGWNAGYANEDTIFDFLETEDPIDAGGWQNYAWGFWFDGTQNPGGSGHFAGSTHTGFYSTAEYNMALDQDWTHDNIALDTAKNWLENDYGVGLAVRGSNFYHAVTLWGIDIDDTTNEYTGIWITDSDNSKGGPDPRPDTLDYYNVSFADNHWRLDGMGFGKIVEMDALRRYVPEPATMILFGFGLLGFAGISRRNFY